MASHFTIGTISHLTVTFTKTKEGSWQEGCSVVPTCKLVAESQVPSNVDAAETKLLTG